MSFAPCYPLDVTLGSLSLSPWTLSDYSLTDGFCISSSSCANFAQKPLLMESVLATKVDSIPGSGKLFDTSPDSYFPPFSVKTVPNEEVIPLVSLFPFEWDWSKWGGDTDMEWGQNFYSVIMAHFGRTHIMTVQTKMALQRVAKDADTSAQDTLMEYLANLSIQIFGWFAQVFDNNGNVIPNTGIASIDNLKSLMKYMIFADNRNTVDYHQPTPLDLNKLTQAFSGFYDQMYAVGRPFHGTPQAAQAAELLGLCDGFLKKALYYKEGRGYLIDFLDWRTLMKVHQHRMHMCFDMYRDLFNTNNCSSAYLEKKHMLNEFCCKSIDTGRQMAAFFGLFNIAVNFLDVVLDSIGSANPSGQTAAAIPADKRINRAKKTNEELLAKWQEHVCLFNDYAKVAALKNVNANNMKLLQIQLNMLDSCGALSVELGKIMRDLDCIVRHRKLYSMLAPPPHAMVTFLFSK